MTSTFLRGYFQCWHFYLILMVIKHCKMNIKSAHFTKWNDLPYYIIQTPQVIILFLLVFVSTAWNSFVKLESLKPWLQMLWKVPIFASLLNLFPRVFFGSAPLFCFAWVSVTSTPSVLFVKPRRGDWLCASGWVVVVTCISLSSIRAHVLYVFSASGWFYHSQQTCICW